MDEMIETRFRNVAKSKTFRNIIATFGLGNKSVLDIGCTYGEYLTHFGKGSTGLTLVREEVAYGKAHGLDIRYGDIESPDFTLEKTYDVIFANNLLEHMHAPHLFLTSVKRFLAPEGLLILGVPCVPKIKWLLRFPKFKGSLAVSHINFYTRDTLALTAKRAGWKVHSVRGFRFAWAPLDHLLDLIYPHFYVAATVDPAFDWNIANPHYPSSNRQWLETKTP